MNAGHSAINWVFFPSSVLVLLMYITVGLLTQVKDIVNI